MRILVVDDDESIRTVVEILLTDEGHTVLTAADGIQALGTVERSTPDLILLDIGMPRMDGPEFIRTYRARSGPHAPIVVFTAARDAPRWSTQLAAQGHLDKPFDLEQLLDVVAAFSSGTT